MKKQYINPEVEIILAETQEALAASVAGPSVASDDYNGETILSREIMEFDFLSNI